VRPSLQKESISTGYLVNAANMINGGWRIKPALTIKKSLDFGQSGKVSIGTQSGHGMVSELLDGIKGLGQTLY
jgi:hypothetical protein